VTAPARERCLTCGEGLVRFDPWTGEERCGQCGARPDRLPPVVGGGQGRSAEDIEDFAPSTIAVAVVLVTVSLGIAFWAVATYWKGLPS